MSDWIFSIRELHDTGDVRGSSYSVPAELLAGGFPAADMHIATIESGAVRGNHYHTLRHEILVVMASDRWSLHWDEGANTPTKHREFDGQSAVLVTVPTSMSHAIRNDGQVAMRMVGLSNMPYDADRPDVYPRQVVAPRPHRS